MNLDPVLISPPVFRFPQCATRYYTICQKEKFLKFRVSHFSSHAPAFIYTCLSVYRLLLLPALRSRRERLINNYF
jgi:hypothetical protein